MSDLRQWKKNHDNEEEHDVREQLTKLSNQCTITQLSEMLTDTETDDMSSLHTSRTEQSEEPSEEPSEEQSEVQSDEPSDEKEDYTDGCVVMTSLVPSIITSMTETNPSTSTPVLERGKGSQDGRTKKLRKRASASSKSWLSF